MGEHNIYVDGDSGFSGDKEVPGQYRDLALDIIRDPNAFSRHFSRIYVPIRRLIDN